MKRRAFGRRVFLRGAGSVAIGLPLCAALERFGEAQELMRPSRYLSVYFGNGVPKKFADQGYDGVFAPLAPFAGKLAMLRGMQVPFEPSLAEAHWRATSRFGIGYTAETTVSCAGESLDNALFEQQGAGTALLTASMHGRAEGHPATRYYHSWRAPRVANPVLETPRALFDAIFGAPMAESELSPAQLRENRYYNSVLDSVVEQYRHVMSERSGYSAGVRSLIADHLELVRGVERRVEAVGGSLPATVCRDDPPARPGPETNPLQLCTETSCPDETPAVFGDDDTANWNEVWPLFCELYTLALRCGTTRFGTLGCTGSGDRYPIPELKAQGIIDTPHILAHEWTRAHENGFDLCVHWLIEKIALLLSYLDDPAWPDPDGGTLLDNMLLLFGSELGTATDGQHYADAVTFFLGGTRGQVIPGIYDYPQHSDVDLYSSIARVMGLSDRFGDQSEFRGYIGALEGLP